MSAPPHALNKVGKVVVHMVVYLPCFLAELGRGQSRR